MKVKSILNLSAATRIRILEPSSDEHLIDHDVDYVGGPENPEVMYDKWIRYGSIYYLPDRVKDAEVKLITADGQGELTIYIK